MRTKIVIVSGLLLLVVALFWVGCLPLNHPPLIYSLVANPPSVDLNGTSLITCTASDPDSDPLNYAWTAAAGTLSPSSSSNVTIWTAPNVPGTYRITVVVDDGRGGIDDSWIDIIVAPEIPVVSEQLIDNPTFAQGLANWEIQQWINVGLGNIWVDAQNDLHWKRWNSLSDSGHVGVHQELDSADKTKILNATKLIFKAKIHVISHSLPDSGWWSDTYGGDGEYPVLISIHYYDAVGTYRIWWSHGFLTQPNTANLTNYTQVGLCSWYDYISIDLLGTDPAYNTLDSNHPNPPYQQTGTINQISIKDLINNGYTIFVKIGGDGWDFEGEAGYIKLWVIY